MFHSIQAVPYHTNIYKWTIFPGKKLELPSPELFGIIIHSIRPATDGIPGMPGWAASSQGSLLQATGCATKASSSTSPLLAPCRAWASTCHTFSKPSGMGGGHSSSQLSNLGIRVSGSTLHSFTLPGLPPSHSTTTKLQDTYPSPLLLQGWATLAFCAWNLLHSEDLEAEALL